LVGPRIGGRTTEWYIEEYCIDGTKKTSGKIPIKEVMDHALRTMLFTITRAVGSVLHIWTLMPKCSMPLNVWSLEFLTGVKDSLRI
jgi:hypothetical protein